MSRRIMVVLAIAIVAIVGWYAFRPERLVIDQKVNEQFPTASAASNKLASGQFHSGAHETKGTATVFQHRLLKRKHWRSKLRLAG